VAVVVSAVVQVKACHLGWCTLLKCNKTNHACLPACLQVKETATLQQLYQMAYQEALPLKAASPLLLLQTIQKPLIETMETLQHLQKA
jgi:hypothetical protein